MGSFFFFYLSIVSYRTFPDKHYPSSRGSKWVCWKSAQAKRTTLPELRFPAIASGCVNFKGRAVAFGDAGVRYFFFFLFFARAECDSVIVTRIL